MALRNMPKAMGLDTDSIKKGDFPHLLNKIENMGKQFDCHPPASYYDPDGMKLNNRANFLQWHDKQKCRPFDFDTELIQYCKADVSVLQCSIIAFRQQFMKMTTHPHAPNGIDPFAHSFTIASACNQVYRQLFLTKHTIGIIPSHGYIPRHKQSCSAVRWLISMQHDKKFCPPIQHARNGGEVMLPDIGHVDGFRPPSSTEIHKGTVYEFHGCYWHGHSCRYSPDTYNYRADATMGDLFGKTQERKRKIQKIGYQYVEMWECEWHERLHSDKPLSDLVNSLDIQDPLCPRDALMGGRTNGIKLHHIASDDEAIRYYDVKSLYPFVNTTKSYPVGHPTVHVSNFGSLDTAHVRFKGLFKCAILPPQNLYIPLLGYKSDGKLTFPLCRTCVDTSTTNCEHSDMERALVGTWTCVEICKAVNLGYKLLQIYEVWEWDEWKEDMFADYMKTFFKVKEEASGWPPECVSDADKQAYISMIKEREGITLETDKVVKNPGLRQVAKLCLNNLWGRFAMRNNMLRVKYVETPEEFFSLLTDTSLIVKHVHILGDRIARVDFTYHDDFIEEGKSVNVVIAAYTTAYARLELYRYLEQLQERTLYFDTDSILFVGPRNPNDEMIKTGDGLGELTDELPPNTFIKEFVCAGPKNYAYQLNNGSCKVVVKGITLNYRSEQYVNFASIKQVVLNAGTEKISVVEPCKIQRSLVTTTLSTAPFTNLNQSGMISGAFFFTKTFLQ